MQRLYLNALKEHILDTEMVVDIELLPQQPLTVVEAVIAVLERTGRHQQNDKLYYCIGALFVLLI